MILCLRIYLRRPPPLHTRRSHHCSILFSLVVYFLFAIRSLLAVGCCYHVKVNQSDRTLQKSDTRQSLQIGFSKLLLW